MLGIGIDTGGTCTDAVLYDYDTEKILGEGKSLTTKQNLEIGIANALDQLPQDLMKKAEMIILSTTLATNACMENKGARAKLLMLGFDETMVTRLKNAYAGYGLDDLTQLVLMDGKVEGIYTEPFDPDWKQLKAEAENWFSDCSSIGIVQKHPRANGGRFERTALKILQEKLDLPMTVSHEISNETDILKTAAGTMLNARLIPLIREFMEAVRHVLAQRGLHIPISIVRSDGTQMSEEMAQLYPVETILCGPAASVVGGSELAGADSAVIVDMGGTTTDIAIIREKEPILEQEGIRIGQWRTMVGGLKVETFGLGGDTAVRYANDHLYLDTVRVLPLSVLASQYDHVVPELKKLAAARRFHAGQVHEFFVLLKDISGKSGYTPQEQQICEVLREKPLISLKLAEKLDRDLRFIDTSRLEEEGIIIKSGLTPTDMMVIKGDFTLYPPEAALAAVDTLMMNIAEPLEEVPDRVYEMVWHRMYTVIGKVLLSQEWPKEKAFLSNDVLTPMLECCYEQAKQSLCSEENVHFARLALTSTMPLVGVGAPIHVFLPRVAQLLHTKVIIPEHAKVANALGAAASRRQMHCAVLVKAIYDGAEFQGYCVFDEGKRKVYKKHTKAVEFAKGVVVKKARRWALMQGFEEEPKIDFTIAENRFGHTKDGLLFEVIVRASVSI